MRNMSENLSYLAQQPDWHYDLVGLIRGGFNAAARKAGVERPPAKQLFNRAGRSVERYMTLPALYKAVAFGLATNTAPAWLFALGILVAGKALGVGLGGATHFGVSLANKYLNKPGSEEAAAPAEQQPPQQGPQP